MSHEFNTHNAIMSAVAPSEDGYKTEECVGYIVRDENGVVKKIIISPDIPVEVQEASTGSTSNDFLEGFIWNWRHTVKTRGETVTAETILNDLEKYTSGKDR